MFSSDGVLLSHADIAPTFDFPTGPPFPLWLDHERRSDTPPNCRPRKQRVDGARLTGEIRLYVSPGSVACARAEATLRGLLPNFDRLKLRVIDVARDITAAERDRILFTPTLICDGPTGQTRVLGDLTNLTVLLDVLHSLEHNP